MRTVALAVLAVAAVGCSASSGAPAAAPASPVKNRDGCGTAVQGLIAYLDMKDALAAQTATTDDLARLLAKINSKLGDAASIAAPELAAQAQAAADAAGRIRVALVEGSDVDVAPDEAKLRVSTEAVDAYCDDRR